MHSSIKASILIIFLIGYGTFSQVEWSPSAKINRTVSSVKETQAIKIETPKLTTRAYQFERRLQAGLKNTKLKSLLDIDLHGTVWVSEVSKNVEGKTLRIEFELLQGTDSEVHVSRFPLFIEVTLDQKIKQFKTTPNPNHEAEDDLNILKDFASIYAYGSDQDTSGVYEFRLEKKDDKIKKSKLKYKGDASKTAVILSSETKGTIDARSGNWITAEGKEQINLNSLLSKQTLLTISSFKLIEIDKPLAIKGAIPSKLVETSWALTESSTLKSRPWRELKSELSLIEQFSKTERLSLFHDLTKLLKSDQKAVPDFKKYIELVSNQHGLITFGIGVLASAGSEPAQEVLRQWYGNKFGDAHKILNAFSTANTELSNSTRSFLRDIINSPQSHLDMVQNALFALGSSLKHSNDQESRRVLMAYYTNAQSESSRNIALDAIGNSGDPELLSTLKQSLNSQNTLEREKAVFSVRFMPSDVAAPVLKSAYEDENPNVRQASIRALQYQEKLAIHEPLIRACANAHESICTYLLSKLPE